MLRLHDTATGLVAPVPERDPGSVGLYVCGPTVYGPPHAGHGRFVLVYDVLRRYLEHTGKAVRHVSNVTDVDDKIVDRARAERRDWRDVAAESEEQWWRAMDALGALRPGVVPHATEHVAEMAELVAELVARGHAYETSDGVYLACDTVEGYGMLAHQSVDSLRAGARVAVSEEKRSPVDFALWKKAKPGGPTWPSAFGPGRPGWHTECVVMSLGLLGEGFDLHGGGLDLVFPHHENERAQAVALGRRFARLWVHNGLVTVGGEKMSKSLGNYVELEDLLASADPRAYRMLVLRSSYRSPLEVGEAALADASAALGRVDELARRIGTLRDERGAASGEVDGLARTRKSVGDRFGAAMDEDLATPRALADLLVAVRDANRLLDSGDVTAGRSLGRAALEHLAVLGVEPGAASDRPGTAVLELAGRREEARRSGDYAAADALRSEIAALGWQVDDSPSGPHLRR
ncbi:MAG: cysteine--tRNA ligase [Actinomycetota bacterium]|nr:cysteine--tRNA ligase [Actinomycetota bacterium]